jgi:predicted hotdog family 3-hydroxylacyl-ACP dehydratase
MTGPFPSIASLLPHTGAMVMLESIDHFDETRIVCSTMRHRAADNPMRNGSGIGSRLRALCGIEFAAQAMALHGALRRSPPSALRHGRVAAVREVVVHCRFLDAVEGPLVVECRLEAAAGNAYAYLFTLNGGGEVLLRGTATVMMSEGELA